MPSGPRAARILVAAAPALVLAAALLVPLRDRAYTVDDTLALRQAEHALVDPLHPSALAIVWREVPERVSLLTTSGPVGPWLLTSVVRAGAREWMAHILTGLLLALGLLATASLALRLGLDRWSAALTTLLVASAPSVLALANTAMPDVSALALGAIGMERVWAWRDRRRLDQGIAASLALALAALTCSPLLLLAGVASLVMVEPERLFGASPAAVLSSALPSLVSSAATSQPAISQPATSRRATSQRAAQTPVATSASWRTTLRTAWPGLVAVLLVLAVRLLTRDPLADADAVSEPATELFLKFLDRNLVACLIGWVLAMPLALPWLLVRWRSLRWGWLWQTIAGSMVLLYVAGDRDWFCVAPVAALGAIVLVDVVEGAWRRRDLDELALAAWLLLVPLPALFHDHFAARDLVPAAPAAALLVVRLLVRERARLGPVLFRFIAVATVGLGALLGVAIARADGALAELGRRAARELIAPRIARGEPVWFAGHGGFQWYAENAGARALSTAAPPPSGAIVVASTVPEVRMLRHFERKVMVEVVDDSGPGGRVMDPEVSAGFWTNRIGYLPWMWSGGPHTPLGSIDPYVVWRLNP